MNNGFAIQQFALIERWEMPLAICADGNTQEVPEKYEVFATLESYEAKYGKNVKYDIKSVLEILTLARDNEAGISLFGVLDFAVDIDYEDIEELEPELSAVIELVKAMKAEISEKELLEKIADIEVIFLGEYPKLENDLKFGVHTVKSVQGNYEMIPVFLNEKNAEEYNTAKHPITKTTINDLKRFYGQFGIIVEPQKKYWAVIEPEKK